jgi:hypothetical protein
MKRIQYLGLSLSAGVMLMASTQASAWFDPNYGNKAPQSSRAAGCAPATAITFLELNNVRALIENGGSLWQDRAASRGAYYVPKPAVTGEVGPSALFSGSLWMGGVDVNNQLKFAGVLFRQGNDFWPGPLTTTGDAEVSADVCLEYDKFFHITRAEVEQYVAFCKCVTDPDCDETVDFAGYSVPSSITNWPAHGDVSLNQDFYLAPFYDVDGDGVYNPDPFSSQDYPWYDIEGDIECNANDRKVILFGDDTFWWIFNDKGNVHTETGGDPIGMEIRAQAFAFSTNDEVNNMTFYNYELINRSTQTLTNTFFGQYADADLGCSEDDFAGCDVRRGLGYVYNADLDDNDGCNGAIPYGANPPAIGIDFFEGPYKDNDGVDNPGPTPTNGYFISYNTAIAGDGIVYRGMGIGYGDSKVDNERFGMRRYVAFNRAGVGSPPTATTDPNTASDYYNYLRGFWKDGTCITYGGNGYNTGGVCTEYMFPGNSDVQGWGTSGVPQAAWSEVTEGNAKGDRRFVQSAGPFTLQPGARNNITVGVVWARAAGGGIEAPVDAIRLADDKAQALFDNCFEILEGPDAPDVRIQELENELLLYLSNSTGNNVGEDFVKEDPFIVTPDNLLQQGIIWDNEYRFQGYQIFQLADGTVSASELYDVDRARLIFQCDLKDNVSQLINWTLDESIGVISPQEMVDGENDGVRHSFRVTEDQFATGNRKLVNHKKYYFMAIAYSHNEYSPFDPTDPLLLDGQKKPYLASRKNGQGLSIKVYTGIPHHPNPEAGGTQQNSLYGDGPKITRIEGQGNGGLVLDLTPETEARIIANYTDDNPEYQNGRGPVNIKVVDPLNVVSADFELKFIRGSNSAMSGINLGGLPNLAEATWELTNLTTGEVVTSDETIIVGNEQIIPEWGISLIVEQSPYYTDAAVPNFTYTDLIESSIEYADSSRRWLSGIEDGEGLNDDNWIRAGNQIEDDVDTAGMCPYISSYNDYGTDLVEQYENIIDGTWAPYSLCGVQKRCVDHMPIGDSYADTRTNYDFSDLQSVDIVFTSDKSKWTRCAVIEMGDYTQLTEGGINKMELRAGQSLDKDGNPDGTGTGMGWFPGYAIDVETGERLNMAFGEDSWLAVDNGRDMLWNPTSTITTDLGDAVFGGKHFVYIFKNEARILGSSRMPAYDDGVYIESKLKNASITERKRVWRSCIWVGAPMLADGQELLSNDVKIRIRVKKPYERYATGGFSMVNTGQDTASSVNTWLPLYRFTTTDIATATNVADTAVSALDMINVVPNPYYAFSAYESDRLDTRIKITNLPEICNISIFTTNGTLVRKLTKDDPLTSVEWDLKNYQGIPIAGGTYIIHIDVPGVGEKILKWFGAVRPPDLDNF